MQHHKNKNESNSTSSKNKTIIILITLYCDTFLYFNLANALNWSLTDIACVYALITNVIRISAYMFRLMDKFTSSNGPSLNDLDMSIMISLAVRPLVSSILIILCIISGNTLSALMLLASLGNPRILIRQRRN